MRFIPLNKIKPDMIVAVDLLNKQGGLLVEKGTILNSMQVLRLQNFKLSGIFISDGYSEEEIKIISTEVKRKALNIVSKVFSDNESSNKNEILHVIKNIINDILNDKNAVYNFIDLKLMDEYTFFHSVEVCIISLLIGMELDLNMVQLEELGIAALLHDIGKIFVPTEILNKSTSYTDDEYSEMKKHSLSGAKHLYETFNFKDEIIRGVTDHHEKFDGTGYPHKLKGEEISVYGRIISIADVYDATMSERVYKEAFLPTEAIENIMANSGISFDPVLVKAFLKRVTPYPVGFEVILSDGRTGLVNKTYPDAPLRPLLTVDKEVLDLRNDFSLLNLTILNVKKRG